MIQRMKVPEWGRILCQSAPRSRRARFLVPGSMLIALGVSGCAVAPDVSTSPIGQTLTESLVEGLLYPLLILQTALGVSALALTIRVTGGGAADTLRARWIDVFSRLRPGLVFVTLVRLALIVLVLRDLTAFDGRAMDVLIGGSPLSVPTAILGLVLAFTAALLIPFTMVAFDAAAGVFLSVLLKKRLYSRIFQLVELVLRAAFVVVVTWLTLGFIAGSLPLGPWLAWLTVFGFGAFADWGLMTMHLGFTRAVWVTIPYGIFIGAAMFLWAICQFILAILFLRWSVALAKHRDRTHSAA